MNLNKTHQSIHKKVDIHEVLMIRVLKLLVINLLIQMKYHILNYKKFLGCLKNEDLDYYLTNVVPDALVYDSDDNIECHQMEEYIFISTIDKDEMEDDVYIPPTNTGNSPLEIKESVT